MKMLAFALAFCFASCAHVTPVATTCAAEVAPDIANDVNAALETDQYAAALEDLVTKFGLCVIETAVRRVAEQPEVAAAYAARASDQTLMIQRARAWLASRASNGG